MPKHDSTDWPGDAEVNGEDVDEEGDNSWLEENGIWLELSGGEAESGGRYGHRRRDTRSGLGLFGLGEEGEQRPGEGCLEIPDVIEERPRDEDGTNNSTTVMM